MLVSGDDRPTVDVHGLNTGGTAVSAASAPIGRYGGAMTQPLVPQVSADTDPGVHRMMVERWRAMTVADRAAVVERLCADVERLARAGIAARYPDYTELEICHELARRRYGSRLADAAYADLLATE